MKYNELVVAASRGELTADNINEIVLAINNANVERDRKDKERDQKIARHDRGLRDVETEYPLLPAELTELSKEIKKKGVSILCGVGSNAYKDRSMRSKVYQDIHREVKRQYGLVNDRGGYMHINKLKRKHLKGAIQTVRDYVAPMALEEEINELNELDMDN